MRRFEEFLGDLKQSEEIQGFEDIKDGTGGLKQTDNRGVLRRFENSGVPEHILLNSRGLVVFRRYAAA